MTINKPGDIWKAIGGQTIESLFHKDNETYYELRLSNGYTIIVDMSVDWMNQVAELTFEVEEPKDEQKYVWTREDLT